MRCLQVQLLLVLGAAICLGNDLDSDPENKLRVVFSWKALDFDFGSATQRELAVRSGRFRPGAAIPIDVDVHYGRAYN